MSVVATCELVSKSPYSQSRFVQEPKRARETGEEWEHRCWKMRAHVDADGNVFIPPMVFKNSLSEAAKYISMQVAGKGKATYTKHFEAGIMVVDPVPLGVKENEIKGEWLHVPSDGRRGGTKRVMKCFPKFDTWKAKVVFHVLDPAITKDVFEKHLEECGNFIGIGRFRPRNNGYYGRFDVAKIDWKERE